MFCLKSRKNADAIMKSCGLKKVHKEREFEVFRNLPLTDFTEGTDLSQIYNLISPKNNLP